VPFAVLLAALAEVPDFCHAQGQRYSMSYLLLSSVHAVLTGATSCQKITTFIALQRERLNAIFGVCLPASSGSQRFAPPVPGVLRQRRQLRSATDLRHSIIRTE